MLQVHYQRRRWRVLCPFCRHSAHVTAKRVKKLMCQNCPDHAKVVESEIGSVAVIHAPGPEGRDVERSTLQMLPTSMPDVVDESVDEVKELEAEMAEAQIACEKLQEENESLRQDVRFVFPRARPL